MSIIQPIQRVHRRRNPYPLMLRANRVMRLPTLIFLMNQEIMTFESLHHTDTDRSQIVYQYLPIWCRPTSIKILYYCMQNMPRLNDTIFLKLFKMIERKSESRDQAYMIKKTNDEITLSAESPPMNPQAVQQNADKSYISKCLARLKRYRKFAADVESNNALAAFLEKVLPNNPIVHFFAEDYFVIQTVKIFFIFRWVIGRGSNLEFENEGKEFKFSEEIKCLDIIKAPDEQLKIAVVTLSSNNIYSLYIFFNNTKIHQFDLNEKICGVTFINTDGLVLVLHLERQIIIYTEDEDKKFQPQRPYKKKANQEPLENQEGPDSAEKGKPGGKKSKETAPNFQGTIISTKMHAYKNSIYSAYLVRGKEENLVLDAMRVEGKAIVDYRQYTLERYTKDKEDENRYHIKDMMIIQEKPDEVSILLVLQREVLLIRLDTDTLKPKIQCPYEWKYEEDYFMLNPKLLKTEEEFEDKKSFASSQTKAEDFLLMIKYHNSSSTSTDNKQGDRTQRDQHNSATETGKLFLLNIRSFRDKIKQRFETSLKDIVSVPNQQGNSNRQLIRCCVYQDKMVFFFFNTTENESMHSVEIFYTTTIDPQEKIDRLLPDTIRIEGKGDHKEQFKQPQNFIPKQDLIMLLKLNETYQKDATENKLYKCVWSKVKTLLKEERNKGTEVQMLMLESYATYLYKVNNLKYVRNELKSIIADCGVRKSFLKKYYIAVKKIAKQKIESGQLDKNFQTYLKSTFFLKKLYLFHNSENAINEKSYNNWKSKDITKELLNEVKSRNKNALKEIINLFKSYFIENYQKIIRDIFQQETSKGMGMQPSILESKQILQVLLPHYPFTDNTMKKDKDKDQDLKKLAFEVSGQLEETCFDDLKLNISRNTELMQFKKVMVAKYMKNNDFLFKQRKELTEKEDNLVNKSQAVYTFLSEISQRAALFAAPSPSQYPNQGSMTSIEPSQQRPPEERFLYLLLKHRFISTTLYLDLYLYVKLFKLYKKDVDEQMSMKEFLSTSLSEIFYNIVFGWNEHNEVYKKIKFLLTKAMMEWEPIFQALQDQVLDVAPSETEEKPYEQPIFESYVESCFQTAREKNRTDLDILEKCKIFLEVIRDLQIQGVHNYQFTIEKIMKTIFKFLRTSYFDLASEIKDIAKDINLAEDMTAEHLYKTLKIFCDNFEFFKTFKIDTEFENLECKEQENFSSEVPYYAVKEVVIVQILQNYIEKKIQNHAPTPKVLTPPAQSYGDIHQNKGSLFEAIIEVPDAPTFRGVHSAGESEVNEWSVTFDGELYNFNKPQNMLKLLMKFTWAFFRNANNDWQGQIFQIFLDVLLDFQLQKPQQLNLLQDLKAAVESDDIEISSETKRDIFYSKLKDKIEQSKKPERSNPANKQQLQKLIGQCLNILAQCDQMKTYVRQQQLILKLKNSQYNITDIPQLREEKESIIKEIQQIISISTDPFSNEIKRFSYNDIGSLNELFEQSTSKKCDDYIDHCLKEKFNIEDLMTAIQNLENVKDLFEPLYLILRLMDVKEVRVVSTDSIDSVSPSKQQKNQARASSTSIALKTKKMISNDELQKKSQQNLIQLKCNLVRNFIVNGKGIGRFLQKNWDDIRATQTNKQQSLDKSHLKCDIEMYYYVPEFLHECKYYTYVQLLYNNYERGARLFVRYRKKLNMDIEKVMQLTRIFVKRNKENIVNHLLRTMQMLANFLQGNVELFKDYDQHFIKKDILGREKPKDPKEAKAYERLEAVYDLYTYYDRNVLTQQRTNNMAGSSSAPLQNRKTHTSNISSIGQDHPHTYNQNDKVLVGAEFMTTVKELFDSENFAEFIRVVEVCKEKKISNDSDDGFNMFFFRLFASCIKFDEKLGKIFPFEFFLEKSLEYKTDTSEKVSRNSKLRDIFNKHLRKPIEAEICEQNYVQIAKAVRFGFHNFAELELKIILIYLEKMISEKRQDMKLREGEPEYNDVQEEMDIQRCIKSVIDNIDLSELNDDNKEEFINAGVKASQYDSLRNPSSLKN